MSVAHARVATIGFGTRFLDELGTQEQGSVPAAPRAGGRHGDGPHRARRRHRHPRRCWSTSAADTGDFWVINGNQIFITARTPRT